MFDGMILQLENTAGALYEKDACRIFLLQAYQESIVLRQKAAALGLSMAVKPLLDQFYALNCALVNASSDRYFNKQGLMEQRLGDLVDDMRKFDQELESGIKTV